MKVKLKKISFIDQFRLIIAEVVYSLISAAASEAMLDFFSRMQT